MDQLPALGTHIPSIIQPTTAIYTPLLEKNAQAIQSTRIKPFRYGDHTRQELDVYYPSNLNTSSRPKALLFLHGGGLVRGSKALTPLVYANLGHFFASYNIITLIANYRLLEHDARFPSGGEDIAAMLTWLHHNLHDLSPAAHEHGIELSIMGNSAGGLHLATYLLAPHFSESRHEVLGHSERRKIWLENAIFLAAPMDMQDSLPERKPVNDAYYGDKVAEHCPLGLLKSDQKPFEGLKGVLVLVGSLDPEEVLGCNKRFFEECKSKGIGQGNSAKLVVEELNGHNHISPVLAVGSGVRKEEAWADKVVKFIEE